LHSFSRRSFVAGGQFAFLRSWASCSRLPWSSFAGLGIAGRYERLLSVPAPIVAAGLAAVLVLPLVFLLVRRSHPAGGPGA